jgi:hypothetical protein
MEDKGRAWRATEAPKLVLSLEQETVISASFCVLANSIGDATFEPKVKDTSTGKSVPTITIAT